MQERQVYVLQIKEVVEEHEAENNEVEEVEGEIDSIQVGQLSLNAMWGIRSNQTMMIKGNCGKRKMHILIDTGNTHNFLNERLAKQMKCEVIKVPGLWVEVANGQELKCNSMCQEFQWSMQQQEYNADVYLLPSAGKTTFFDW